MQHQNRQAWDAFAAKEKAFCKVATDAECVNPLKTLDSRGWLPESVQGLNVLCLACGGGWQSILYASAGANVTVIDLSPGMLALDRREADRRGLVIEVVEGEMANLHMFANESFDIDHHPVSTCYVPEVAPVYREIARVSRVGGLYISQHKTPTSLQILGRDQSNCFVLGVPYYLQGPLPHTGGKMFYRERGTVEYLHRWDQIVGELCRSGFVIEDLREPYKGDWNAAPGTRGYRGLYVAPYVRLKARRVGRSEER